MVYQSSPQESAVCTCKGGVKIPVKRFHSHEEKQKLVLDKTDYSSYYSAVSKVNGNFTVRPLDPANRVTLSWFNIDVQVKAKKKKFFNFSNKKEVTEKNQLLSNVNGEVRPGTLLAVMGASGAGKTTLLNVLTRRNLRLLEVQGEVQVNGQVVGESITGISAYVQQEDLFIGTLTVHEHLVFQALLRMDRHLSYKDRMKRVDQVIVELGLSKCKNTMIGVAGKVKGISGGEAKRLALAAEVLTNPSLMFCDEPTSGLDSFMSQSIVSVLRQMAEGGRTILCTIHQPSSEVYGLFDNLLLMAEGRVAYKGKADRAIDFFNRVGLQCPINYNPADFFVQSLAIVPGQETECRAKIKRICDQFAKEDLDFSSTCSSRKSFMDTHPQTKSNRYKAPWFRQFRAVLWRSWISAMREQYLNKVRIIQIVFIAVLFGSFYWQQKNDENSIMNINGALFSMLLIISSQNMLAVINVLKMEQPLFLREYWNGMYRTDVYFLAKTITEAPIILFLTIIYGIITYFMIGLNNSVTAFFICLAVLVLVADTGASFGYMVSCISSTLRVALTISYPLVMPLIISGGFYLNADSVPIYLIWLKYISWFFYGNEALAVNQWKDVTNITCYTEFCPHDGEDVLAMLSFHEGYLLRDILSILLLMILYRLLAFFALHYKASRST